MREYCSVFTQCLFASMLIPAHQKHTATYTATRTSKQHNRYITWYHAVKGRRRQLSLFFIFGMAWICTDICIWLLCVVYHVQCSVCVCVQLHALALAPCRVVCGQPFILPMQGSKAWCRALVRSWVRVAATVHNKCHALDRHLSIFRYVWDTKLTFKPQYIAMFVLAAWKTSQSRIYF